MKYLIFAFSRLCPKYYFMITNQIHIQIKVKRLQKTGVESYT